MAIWQCDFYVVPRQRLMQADGTIAAEVSAEEWHSADWWSGVRFPESLDALFDQLLPRGRSRNPDTTFWGEDDGTRIEIQRGDGVVLDVFVRLDARTVSVELLERLASAAQLSGAVFVGSDLIVIPATPGALVEMLERSRASRYLRDPKLYLRRIALGGWEDA
jgi:hypothetical protein